MISGCFAIVLGKAKTKAQGIQCMGNLRQLNQAGAEAFITINTPPLIGALDGFMGFANGQFCFPHWRVAGPGGDSRDVRRGVRE